MEKILVILFVCISVVTADPKFDNLISTSSVKYDSNNIKSIYQYIDQNQSNAYSLWKSWIKNYSTSKMDKREKEYYAQTVITKKFDKMHLITGANFDDFESELMDNANNDDFINYALLLNQQVVEEITPQPVRYNAHFKVLRDILANNKRGVDLRRIVYYELGGGYMDTENIKCLLGNLKKENTSEAREGVGMGINRYYKGMLKTDAFSVDKKNDQKKAISATIYEYLSKVKVPKENRILWYLAGKTAEKDTKTWLYNDFTFFKEAGVSSEVTTGLAENIDSNELDKLLIKCGIESGKPIDGSLYNVNHLIKYNLEKILNSNQRSFNIAYLYGINEGIINCTDDDADKILNNKQFLQDTTCAKWIFIALHRGLFSDKDKIKSLFANYPNQEIAYLYKLYGYDQTNPQRK